MYSKASYDFNISSTHILSSVLKTNLVQCDSTIPPQIIGYLYHLHLIVPVPIPFDHVHQKSSFSTR